MNASDKVWLVKSKGHILGPFTSPDVEGMIRDGEISIEDSLCVPYKIWRKVSDFQNFQKIVKEIRNKQSAGKGSKRKPMMDEQTQTIDQDIREDTVTQEINPKRVAAQEQAQNIRREIVIENIKEEVSKRKAETKQSSTEGKNFGYQASTTGQKEAGEFKKVLWRSSISLLVVFLLALLYKTVYIDPEDNKVKVQRYKAQAIEKHRVGDYGEAQKLYEKALAVNPNDFEAMLRLGVYLIQLDDQVFKGQELLRRVIANKGPFPKVAYVGVGLGFHKEKSFVEAQEYYNQALELDGLYNPALINIGALHLERGDYAKARELFADALSGKEEDLGVNIYRALAYIKDPQMRTSPDIWNIERDLNFIGQFDGDYSQEANFLSMYINFIMGKPREAAGRLKDLLDTYPDLTERHRKGLLINRELLSWTVFYDWCMEMANGLGKSPRISALKSLCHFKTGNSKMAKREIEKAIIQSPKDSLLQSFYSAILLNLGLEIESTVALGKAQANNQVDPANLPNIMQATFCDLKEDYDCAEEYWLKVIPTGRNIPVAATGLAVSNFSKKNLVKAKTYLKQAETKSRNYLPLLQLVSDLKRK